MHVPVRPISGEICAIVLVQYPHSCYILSFFLFCTEASFRTCNVLNTLVSLSKFLGVATLKSKGKEDSFKGKDDSSIKSKYGRKVQISFEG